MTFFPANITLCRFLLAANTVQVLSTFQTLVCRITSKPFVSLLCLSVWDRLQSAFAESTFFFSRLPSACGEQNCHLVQPTTYFPAFHLACWQSFLSLQNHFFSSGSAFSRRKQKPFGEKSSYKFLLCPTGSIPDLSAFLFGKNSDPFAFWYFRSAMFRHIYRPLFQWGFTTSRFFSRRPAGSETFATILHGCFYISRLKSQPMAGACFFFTSGPAQTERVLQSSRVTPLSA